MGLTRIGSTVAALAAVAIAAALAAGGGESAGAAGPAQIEATKVASFSSPTYVSAAPGRASRGLLFVVERGGKVRVLDGSEKQRRPFLDISDEVDTEGERGMLSIAFDPGYATNRRFYVYYADPTGRLHVSRFKSSARSPTRALARTEADVLTIRHPETVHNGGTIAFGPDGNLWVGTGDGGGSCDPPENAQDPSSLLGKILRIAPLPEGGYSTPARNPYVGRAGRDEVYALGLRNPYRFSFDPENHALAIGDVGQSRYEEIDYAKLRGARGANFGWDAFEGPARLEPSQNLGCAKDDRTPAPADRKSPILSYPHSGSGFTGCAVVGGLVVRDPRLSSLTGRYLYADLCSRQVRSLSPTASGDHDDSSVGVSIQQPTSFGTDRRDHVYVTSLAGSLYRLDQADG